MPPLTHPRPLHNLCVLQQAGVPLSRIVRLQLKTKPKVKNQYQFTVTSRLGKITGLRSAECVPSVSVEPP